VGHGGLSATSEGCAADCMSVEDGFACPSAGGACEKLCGNGTLDGLEECDDKNGASNDGCSAACQKEPGFRCPTPGQACVPDARCGDGVVQQGEECDDGDLVTGNGCSAACTIEPFYDCPPAGGAC